MNNNFKNKIKYLFFQKNSVFFFFSKQFFVLSLTLCSAYVTYFQKMVTTNFLLLLFLLFLLCNFSVFVFANFPSSIVAYRTTCSSSSSPEQCAVTYPGASSICVCPSQTIAINVTMLDAGYARSSAKSSYACGSGQIIVGLCSTTQTSGVNSLSAFVEDVASFSSPLITTSCSTTNPETGACSCSTNRTLAFPIFVPSSTSTSTVSRITFCMPIGFAVFFDEQTQQSNCVHPLGSNYSCKCRDGATKTMIPVSIFKNQSSVASSSVGNDHAQSISGVLTFCGSDSQKIYPPSVTVGVSAATVAVSVFGAIIAGSNVAVLQGAAMMMAACSKDVNDTSATSMTTFAQIDSAGDAKGWVFMLALGAGTPLVHLLFVTFWAIFCTCTKREIVSFEAPQSEGESNQNFVGHQSAASPSSSSSFPDQWLHSASRFKFPHISLNVTQLAFAGFSFETARMLFASSTVLHVDLGCAGAVICVVYIIFVFYVCYFKKADQMKEDEHCQLARLNEFGGENHKKHQQDKAKSDLLLLRIVAKNNNNTTTNEIPNGNNNNNITSKTKGTLERNEDEGKNNFNNDPHHSDDDGVVDDNNNFLFSDKNEDFSPPPPLLRGDTQSPDKMLNSEENIDNNNNNVLLPSALSPQQQQQHSTRSSGIVLDRHSFAKNSYHSSLNPCVVSPGIVSLQHQQKRENSVLVEDLSGRLSQ